MWRAPSIFQLGALPFANLEAAQNIEGVGSTPEFAQDVAGDVAHARLFAAFAVPSHNEIGIRFSIVHFIDEKTLYCPKDN